MSLALLLVPLIAQMSPLGSGAGSEISLPTIDRAPNAPNPRKTVILPHATVEQAAPLTKLGQCMTEAGHDPDEAVDRAKAWLAQAKGPAMAEPEMCLGTAYSQQGDWESAAQAFLSGRDAAVDKTVRARMGAMAGNAALAGGAPERALAILDTAHTEAGGDPGMTGSIAVDRARALVALKRDGEAVAALSEARMISPDDSTAWLLSATLSRRMNRLAEAQTQIEKAAELAPTDPDIGLEAGVIAMLAGHEDAARRSWQSVVKTSPDSPAARQAGTYLDEVGPTPASPSSATGTPAPAGAPSSTPAPHS